MFAAANQEVTARLDRTPTTHEQAVDLGLIDTVAAAVGAHIMTSGVVVDVDVHFLGGGAHWQRWEVADVGVILNFRRSADLLRTKVLLLQSKRLCPREARTGHPVRGALVNTARLHFSLDYATPVEFEDAYHRQINA